MLHAQELVLSNNQEDGNPLNIDGCFAHWLQKYLCGAVRARPRLGKLPNAEQMSALSLCPPPTLESFIVFTSPMTDTQTLGPSGALCFERGAGRKHLFEGRGLTHGKCRDRSCVTVR